MYICLSKISIYMKSLLAFVAFFFIALQGSVYAQKTWTYKQYGLQFTTPADFNVRTNDAKSFVASDGKSITLSIYPYKDASVTKEKIADIAWNKINATNKKSDERIPIDLDGYKGYAMVGSGLQNNKELLFIAFGCIDPTSETNFYSIIYYWNDSNADANTDKAIGILKSFKKVN